MRERAIRSLASTPPAADPRDEEIERLKIVIDILQNAMTAKLPIPMPFKKALLAAQAALRASSEKEPKT